MEKGKQNFEEEYKDHLLCVRRFFGRSGFYAYAMKFREPGNASEPFAGRVTLPNNQTFTGKGAKLAALEAIKKAVDNSEPELNSHYAQSLN